MNFKKIDILLGMKDIQRLPNTPHHRGYNLLEHGLVVGMLFRWFASEEDVAYDINVFDSFNSTTCLTRCYSTTTWKVLQATSMRA